MSLEREREQIRTLRHVHGLSMAAIAATLKISDNKVWRLLRDKPPAPYMKTPGINKSQARLDILHQLLHNQIKTIIDTTNGPIRVAAIVNELQSKFDFKMRKLEQERDMLKDYVKLKKRTIDRA